MKILSSRLFEKHPIFNLSILFFLFAFGLCNAQSTITIEVSWPNWSSENRVTFRDPLGAQIGASVCNPSSCFSGCCNNAYNNSGSLATYPGIAYGNNYSLLLEDTYGDGWNGAGSYVRVYQDGVLILNSDLTTGTSNVVFFNILAPTPSLVIDDVSVNENAGTANFTATHIGGNTASAFTATYTTANGSAIAGSDYTAASGTLSFNGTAGDTEQINISITDDLLLETDETFTLQFTGVSISGVDISDIGTGTIQDNENNPNAPRAYQERFAKNLNGDFIMRGNTNLVCVSGCPGTPSTNNPPVVMGYADIDSDPSTVNSSYTNFTIPAGASIEWAGLYWGGVYGSTRSGITNPPGSLNIDQVKFRPPGSSSYTTVNAQLRNIETTSSGGSWDVFMSFAEVTSAVQAAGNGNYYVGDVALATGSAYTGPFGGWSMVIVYIDPTDNTRNISIWDGFNFFGFGANETFTVTGLLTPASGTFQTHAGYFGMDGEANRTGDFVSINGTALANGLNPSNNTLNGTISQFGVDIGARNPNLGYSWAMDADVFDASGLVPNGASSLNVVLGSSSEGIWGGVFAVSNEIAFPAVSSKTFNPPTAIVGRESRVTLVMDNPAKGVSLTNFSITDNLPAGMEISSSPDATSSCGGTLTAVPGSNSFSASGLTILPGNSCTFTFDVTTENYGTFTNIIYPTDTTNDQNIPFEGESSGTLTVKVGTVITNRRITTRVNKD